MPEKINKDDFMVKISGNILVVGYIELSVKKIV